MTMTTSRGEFLTRGMKGGLALVAGGAVLGVAAGPALGQASGDVAIAKLAATAELLAIDVYSKAIKTGFFTGDVLAYMEAARQNEQDHYDALAKVLGAQAPKGVKFTYPAGTFKDAGTIAKTGVALETAFVGAYLGAVEALKDDDLKGVAALVGANEAQHLTTFKRLAAGNTLVPNPSFPKSLTAKQATAAVTPFLA
jgi:rubrerythrin